MASVIFGMALAWRWLGVYGGGSAIVIVLKGMDRIHISESIHHNSPQHPIVLETVSSS